MRTIANLVLFAWIAAGTVFYFMAPPAKGFPSPELARLLFFHLPCAIGATWFMVLGPYFGVRYLASRKEDWDRRMVAAQEMGFVLGALTLLTGMQFSAVQWGAYWNWDPRQTSFLLVMLMVSAFFVLRGAVADPERRAGSSAGYAVATLLPIVFLIFVYPRLPQVVSLHPNILRADGLDQTYATGYLLMQVGIFWLCGRIYRARLRAETRALEKLNETGELADRDDSAPTGVVRPVSVPDAGGKEG